MGDAAGVRVTAPSQRTARKDMRDLQGLPRSGVLSFWQKQSLPGTPRSRAQAAQPTPYLQLAVYLPQRLWQWVSEYVRYRLGPRHAFQTYAGGAADQGVYPLPGADADIRIALAGDWGTGTDEAAAVAVQIADFRPHYAIHLGDVYYVGDPAEVGENFLGIANPANGYQPVRWPHGSAGTFSLNGNHEMYARGVGYFDRLLPSIGIAGGGGQRASYFCLENEHWRIIALDTGYNSVGVPVLEYLIQPDCALPAPLLDWLRDVVRPGADDPRGIIILTHHQYYSRFDVCYPKPAQQLAAFFARPVLWLWGHEHRLAIYRETGLPGGIRAIGRCIGHGGMPIDLPGAVVNPAIETEFVDGRRYPNDENLDVGFNGFAQMTLRGSSLTLAYLDLQGTMVFSEAWRNEGGELVRVG